jgi:hypothetical protein
MRIIILAITMLFFNGCWLMPYQENFSCNADLEAGRCGMIRDNYNLKSEQKKFK